MIAWLAEELVRRGHEVALFASGDSRTTARLFPGALRLERVRPRMAGRSSNEILPKSDEARVHVRR